MRGNLGLNSSVVLFMKIGILSFRSPDRRPSVEESRLREAGLQLGHKVTIYRSQKCQVVFDDVGGRVLYSGKKFPEVDVLIPRASIIREVDIRLAAVKQFQTMGMPLVNEYTGIVRAKNKFRTQQLLHSLGIPTPTTVVIENTAALDKAIELVGGTPVIIKDPFGTFGTGVVIAESKRAARSVIDAIWKGQSGLLLIQEYIEESQGRDTRVFVVGDKVVACMERSAQVDEFRSNMELGGDARAVEVSERYAQIAIQSTKALGLDVSGVDIIDTHRGPAVLEVNANPGFKALEKTTGIDVAKAIIEFTLLRGAGEV